MAAEPLSGQMRKRRLAIALSAAIAAAMLLAGGTVIGWRAWRGGQPARQLTRQELEFIRFEVSRDGAIGTALENFRRDIGRYPTTEEGLGLLMRQAGGPGAPAGFNGPYLAPTSSLDDLLNQALKYVCPGRRNPAGYDLSSAGVDRRFGTDDDIGNWQS